MLAAGATGNDGGICCILLETLRGTSMKRFLVLWRRSARSRLLTIPRPWCRRRRRSWMDMGSSDIHMSYLDASSISGSGSWSSSSSSTADWGRRKLWKLWSPMAEEKEARASSSSSSSSEGWSVSMWMPDGTRSRQWKNASFSPSAPLISTSSSWPCPMRVA